VYWSKEIGLCLQRIIFLLGVCIAKSGSSFPVLGVVSLFTNVLQERRGYKKILGNTCNQTQTGLAKLKKTSYALRLMHNYVRLFDIPAADRQWC